MSKTSTLIGSVMDGTPILDRNINGENFYKILVEFRNAKIPVLMSEYTKTQSVYSGKVKITGSLISDVVKGQLPVYYIYANEIEEADQDEDITNEINFVCHISKSNGFKQDTRGRDILPLVGDNNSPLNTTSVYFICLRDADARKLKNKPVGYTIEGVGYLNSYRDVFEIYVKSATVID